MEKYEYLKSIYPERISLNQLYQICKVAKSTARYLVQNDIIPCIENTDNKTWKYEIALDDVINYLQKKEQCGSMIPKGAIKKKNYASKKQPTTFPAILTSNKKEIEAYFRKIYSSYPDVITTNQAASMTGLNKTTIRELIKKGTLQAISYNHYNNIKHRKQIIPFCYLINFYEKQRISKLYRVRLRVNTPWSQIAKRIDTLINSGRYLSQEDISYIPQYEKKQTAEERM